MLPAKEWVTGARKEAVLLTLRSKSKHELLDRLTENKFGSDWKIKIADAEPLPLRDWLAENHPPTAELLRQESSPPAP